MDKAQSEVKESTASGSSTSSYRVDATPNHGAIAIVGMAFRFPGDLGDEASFWSALKEGLDLVSEVPADRWATNELQHDKRSEPGRSITFSAGVLSKIDEFDAAFFGISPREATFLDPQQRMLLELAWEALENGGQVPSSLAGSDCAVYLGISGFDYGMRQLDDLASMSAYSMTGNTLSVAANRISYVLDLRGPSLAVDTACSSSLVALHHACNSLRSGEVSMALAGGANLLLHPYPFVGFTKASMLSADGRCKAFDASGDGYVRAEGGAMLLLKPLKKALADGDDIQAVILSTGVNADGARKTGITIPSREGQIELMHAVLAKSGLSPAEVDFIEAHGTGTTVGDPIEASAIGTVYGKGRSKPLPIGSVKANIGHMEPASGMGGLIKAVLALKNRALPPAVHLENPNPKIDFQGLNLELVREYKEFDQQKLLVAGVNSFGFGGANAHVLLQEFRTAARESVVGANATLPPLFLSARNDAALRSLAGHYTTLLNDKLPAEFYDIAYAAAYRRERLEQRLAVHAKNNDEVIDLMARYAKGESPEQVVVEEAPAQPGSVAFVYSGNGSQWLGMGRALMSGSACFADIIMQLDAAMKPLTGFSLTEELHADKEASRLDDTVVAQPLLFAMQVALTAMLREQGVEPAAVTGHSVGEIAAAWAAGALTLEQAIRVICARSAAQGETRGTGRMAAVALSAAAMQEVFAELGGSLDVEIAGINSANNVTLSGKLEDLQRIQAHVKAKGIFFVLLDLDYAFHSWRMDPIQNRLVASLTGLAPCATGMTTFVSTVTGSVLEGVALDAGYWWRNVREPVRFADSVSAMADLGCRVFIEVGPHAILQRYVAECLNTAGVKGRVLPTLRKNDDGIERVTDAALRAHLLADKTNLTHFFPQPGRHVRLPNYPWQRERYWIEKTSEGLASMMRRRVHPLLGWRLPDAEASWENVIDPISLPWLADHKVGDAIVFPGAGYAEMALAAACEWLDGKQLLLEDLDIVAPMVFDGDHGRTLRFILNPRDGGFHIKSRQRLSDDAWTLHASGRVLEAGERQALAEIPPVPEPAQMIDHDKHYRLASTLGLDYGTAFQGMSNARVGLELLEAKLVLPDTVQAVDYLLHPGVLDICYQSLVDFFHADIEAGQGVALLPVKAGRLSLYQRATAAWFRARLRRRSARSVLADFELFDGAGSLIASISGCRFRAVPLLQRQQSRVSDWRIVPWLCPHPVDGLATVLPSMQTLAEQLRVVFADNTVQRRAWFKEALPLLEALTLSFAYEGFCKLEQHTPDALQTLMAQASPYARWLASVLQQEALLAEHDGRWQLASSDLPPAEEIWKALLRDTPTCLPQLTLLGRVGTHLPELLVGDIDNQKFFDALRHSPTAETLYEDDPAYLGTRLAIGNALGQLLANWSANRRLRVLEIAAGPSELPRMLIDALPEDRFDYVLTLTDEDTQQRQQSEYQDYANVVVASLNPSDWKLVADRPLPEAFDVVILRHVLHRAERPHVALVQAKHWLAAGGVLLLAERYPDWSTDLLAGLDANWWHEAKGSESPIGVPLSSLLAPEAWERALHDEGFAEVEPFAEPAAEGLAAGSYLLLAKRSEHETAILETPQAAAWMLLTDEASSRTANALASRLEFRGQRVVVAGVEQQWDSSGIDHLVYLLGWNSAPENAATTVSALLRDVQALSTVEGKPPRLWVITRGGALASELPASDQAPSPAQAALWGFCRVAMNEAPALNCTLIDLCCDPEALETIARLENELLYPDGVNELVLNAKARYSLVMREGVAPVTGNAAAGAARFRLDFRVPGQLRNLLWLPEMERALQEHEIEVRTQAAGLNFRDVMYLMGLLPDEAVESGFAGASLGLEFSGVVTQVGARVPDLRPGDAVMGFGSSCFSSHVITRADAVAKMPEGWTFEAAATVPTVFFTVYYALKQLADLQPGERVLIHGGAGGVGIAAIQLARQIGAEIFATAGSEEKRDFVRLLGADHVLDSRSLSFADDVLAITGGEGVDVIVNSLAGEAIRRNLHVLKPFGRFLELGKRDFFENTPIGLRPFKDNISYFGIDADQLLTGRPQLAARLFREVMALFRQGELAPLPYRVFSADHAVDAFRVMQQSRHIGKIVISLADAHPYVETKDEALPQVRFDRASTWLITGGLAGFGLESARWLAQRGVGNLVLLGRRGKDTPGAQEALGELEAKGVNVSAIACDITDAKALGAVIEQIRKTMPPLKGILHAAMVIDDRFIARLDAAAVEAVLRPKLLGAWNLHTLTQNIPLDHFILYSSITTSIGNPGQGNYVAANAGLEGLAGLRQYMGLPVACIGWGPIEDAGYLTRKTDVKESLGQRLGKAPLYSAEALSQLDRILSNAGGLMAVANFDWSVLSRLLPSSSASRFSILNRSMQDKGPAEGNGDIRLLIADKTVEEVGSIVRNLVTQEIAQILSIAADRIVPDRSLHDLGMDSLMAVELAMGLEQCFGVQLPVMMLNESPTVEKITTRLVEKLSGTEESPEKNAAEIQAVDFFRQHGEELSQEEMMRTVEHARMLAENGARLIA